MFFKTNPNNLKLKIQSLNTVKNKILTIPYIVRRQEKLSNTDHNTSLYLPTFHMIVSSSKEGKAIKLLPLVNNTGYSALPSIVKMIFSVDLQDSSRLYYIPTNSI